MMRRPGGRKPKAIAAMEYGDIHTARIDCYNGTLLRNQEQSGQTSCGGYTSTNEYIHSCQQSEETAV